MALRWRMCGLCSAFLAGALEPKKRRDCCHSVSTIPEASVRHIVVTTHWEREDKTVKVPPSPTLRFSALTHSGRKLRLLLNTPSPGEFRMYNFIGNNNSLDFTLCPCTYLSPREPSHHPPALEQPAILSPSPEPAVAEAYKAYLPLCLACSLSISLSCVSGPCCRRHTRLHLR